MSKSKPSEQELPTFSDDKLREALLNAWDMFDRALVPFYVLGETGRHLHKEHEVLTGDTEIRLGIKKAELTREAKLTITSIHPEMDITEYQMSYSVDGVPVIIDIIHTDYIVFQHPEVKFFSVENFLIPNPWSQYWQMRDFIK